MKHGYRLHTLSMVLILGAATVIQAGEPLVCMRGTCPGKPAGLSTKGSAAAQRNAEEQMAGLAPERQAALLTLLNEAGEGELLSIEGIAKERAMAIVEARPFSNLADLLEVRGIGGKTFERILAHPSEVTVSGPRNSGRP